MGASRKGLQMRQEGGTLKGSSGFTRCCQQALRPGCDRLVPLAFQRRPPNRVLVTLSCFARPRPKLAARPARGFSGLRAATSLVSYSVGEPTAGIRHIDCHREPLPNSPTRPLTRHSLPNSPLSHQLPTAMKSWAARSARPPSVRAPTAPAVPTSASNKIKRSAPREQRLVNSAS